MILENIKDFDWYNEPQNVEFLEEGIFVTAAPQTDFWQSIDYKFFKDNGHFFATSYSGDFTLAGKWHFPVIKDSAQCGIMARFDAQNWIKVGLLSPNPYSPQIGVVVSFQGASDWSTVALPAEVKNLWLKIRRRGCDFLVYYSLDGNKYSQIRMLHFSKNQKDMKVGAYACSPKGESFECVLVDVAVFELSIATEAISALNPSIPIFFSELVAKILGYAAA